MSELDDDLAQERHRLADLARRARTRLEETKTEADSLQQRGARAASDGDAKAAGEFERRAQRVRGQQRRYQDLVDEFERSPDRLAAEVLLARLQGPETDILFGEVERSRETLLAKAASLLKARDKHRELRSRWNDLSDKIRELREKRGLPAGRTLTADFRVHVNPQTYSQRPDGPTLREVSDLVHSLGL